MNDQELKKISLDLKDSLEDALKDEKLTLLDGNGISHKVKPNVYLDDRTDDDEGNFGYGVKITVSKRVAPFFIKDETYFGTFSLYTSGKSRDLNISYFDNNLGLAEKSIEKVIGETELKYDVKIE